MSENRTVAACAVATPKDLLSSLTVYARKLTGSAHPEEINKLPALFSSKMSDKDLLNGLKFYREVSETGSQLNCVAGNMDRAIEQRLGISSEYRVWIDTSKGAAINSDGAKVGLPDANYLRLMVAKKHGQSAILDLHVPLAKLEVEGGKADEIFMRAAGLPVTPVARRSNSHDSRPTLETVIKTLEQTKPFEREKLPYLSAHSYHGGLFSVVQLVSNRPVLEGVHGSLSVTPERGDQVSVVVGVDDVAAKKSSILLHEGLPRDKKGSTAVVVPTPYADQFLRVYFGNSGFIDTVSDAVRGKTPRAATTQTPSGFFATGAPDLFTKGTGGNADSIINRVE